jgi:hypothetical protein
MDRHRQNRGRSAFADKVSGQSGMVVFRLMLEASLVLECAQRHHVRIGSKSGHVQRNTEGLLWANSEHAAFTR